MSSPSAFSQTPEDIVQLILSPLQGTEDSFFVGLVCKFWNSVMQRDTSIPEHKLWRYYASFGNISALELLQQILQSADTYVTDILGAAARHGHIHVLNWAKQHLTFKGIRFVSILQAAAENGQIETIKWFHQHGFISVCRSTEVCASAALGGQLETLKFLRAAGYSVDGETIDNAALKGHKDIIIWALENYCEKTLNACANAAEGGHLELLQWLHANNFSMHNSAWIGPSARGHIEILDWLKKNHCPGEALGARRGMKIETLKWMEANGQLVNWENVCRSAAEQGMLDILLFAIEKGADPHKSISKWTIETAVCNGFCNIVQWAKENGMLENPKELVNLAASAGEVKILVWLKENGYCEDWTAEACDNAASKGHLEALKWLYENGCPCDFSTLARWQPK